MASGLALSGFDLTFKQKNGRVDRIKDAIPMKRGGQPEEAAHAILWLLSEQASYATGTFIDLAGGR
ncbi:SDR family oxidoreductase [Rheinheimera soli]|uniref:SDR family oxidoreductase n=1 Tax=Rheinheimera soli TaxID=443616 RepID=UPI001E43E432